MTRIPAENCSSMDVEWYGVDRRGQVAVFCSAGEGNLPEFVCKNAERADELIEFFYAFAPRTTTKLHVWRAMAKTGRVEKVCRDFSDKGLFYFDADANTTRGGAVLMDYYTLRSAPREPLLVCDLPKHIQELLSHNVLSVKNFAHRRTIFVRHAYGRGSARGQA